ncbi:PepSY domain-containing protein [Peribacillus loiseleuriae]|uniref:PepSY domain-containing protein n=1 Tax=Peribacillus loiseleuriae TaxID=1679170 RepID=UPI003D0251F9
MIGTKLLASVLALGVVGGGAVGVHAIQPEKSIQPTSTVNQEETATEEKQDSNEQAKLQKEASITQDEATKTVLAQYQGGTIKQVELEDEDGSVVYGVDVVSKDGKSYDVKVDAKTGKITKAEDDNENGNEADDHDKEVNDDNTAENN